MRSELVKEGRGRRRVPVCFSSAWRRSAGCFPATLSRHRTSSAYHLETRRLAAATALESLFEHPAIWDGRNRLCNCAWLPVSNARRLGACQNSSSEWVRNTPALSSSLDTVRTTMARFASPRGRAITTFDVDTGSWSMSLPPASRPWLVLRLRIKGGLLAELGS